MTINAQNRQLPDWFTRIRTRQIALPRFQRFEAWSHATRTQLFNTILQNLPIGAVLILEIGNKEPFKWRALATAPEKGERITEHLLDGQQRLTSLYRCLKNNYDDAVYFMCIEPDEERKTPYHVEHQHCCKGEGGKEFRPSWVNSPQEQWKRKLIPLHLFAPDDEAQTAYKEWARKAIPDPGKREDINDLRAEIRQKFATFNLPFLSLPVTTEPGTALDVFIKMNTSAAALKIFDIIVAQVEAGLERSLHDMVSDVKSECPSIEFYYDVNNLVLYVGALLQDKPPVNTTYLEKGFGNNMLDLWDMIVTGIKHTAAFLEEERIFDSARLPTDIVVPVLTALWAQAPKGLDAEGRARALFRKYLWRAFFSNRYERSTNTRSLEDYRELRDLVDGKKITPKIFTAEFAPLPQAAALIEFGWPNRKDRLARAILALALKEGGQDLADGSTANRNNLSRREYHHLFPAAYLEDQGINAHKINRSLNCALITWKTNRNISAKEPVKYLAERIDGTGITEEELKKRLGSHLIPYHEMLACDYNAFLSCRAELIHKKMLEMCGENTPL